MKKYSLKTAAEMLGHKYGPYGLSLDLRYATDLPVPLAKQLDNGRWEYNLTDITIPILQAYYESKKKAG